ncbi:MAG TPA: hypothetical protein VGR12_06490 [Solirubrobacteraceae bacterium]|nr:hypothetical protein [Solirubrobacteraceae bacterium]
MEDVDLHLEPNEASDLCPVFEPDVLDEHGWDRAFVTVLDEANVERAIALVVHEGGAAEDAGWSALRVAAKPTVKMKTEDSEACARIDGRVYVLGSQFGKKSGPLQPKRSFVARIGEEELLRGVDGKKGKLDVAPLRFGLHRAVNEALSDAGVELLELGPVAREAYIDKTMAKGAKKEKRWDGRIHSSDHPINVEGAEFRTGGRLLLGLRYPVTAGGDPILLELEHVDALFDDPDAIPACRNVWVLKGAGTRDAPVGIRALHREHGKETFHAIVGNLDSTGKGAAVLEDHPEGGVATSTHIRFELPAAAGGGDVAVDSLHDFDGLRRIEGIAIGPHGHAHYVIDREGRVDLRTLALR